MLKALVISDSNMFKDSDRYYGELDVSYTSFNKIDEEVMESLKNIDIFIIDMNVRDVSRFFYREYFKLPYGREPIIDKAFLANKERSFIILDAQTKDFKIPGVDLSQEEMPLCNNKNLIKMFIPMNWDKANNVEPLISIVRKQLATGYIDKLIFNREYPELTYHLSKIYSGEFNYYHPFYFEDDIDNGVPRTLCVGEEVKFAVAVAYSFNSPGKVVFSPHWEFHQPINTKKERQFLEKMAKDSIANFMKFAEKHHVTTVVTRGPLFSFDLKKRRGDFDHNILITKDNKIFLDSDTIPVKMIEETDKTESIYWPYQYIRLIKILLDKRKTLHDTDYLIERVIHSKAEKNCTKNLVIAEYEHKAFTKMIRQIRKAFNETLDVQDSGILQGDKAQGYSIFADRIKA